MASTGCFGSGRSLFVCLGLALTWDDALECLKWAEEMQATVAEMRAWRRAQRGEDLTAEAVEEEAIRYVPTEAESVHDPAEFSAPGRGDHRPAAGDAPNDRTALTGVARQAADAIDRANAIVSTLNSDDRTMLATALDETSSALHFELLQKLYLRYPGLPGKAQAGTAPRHDRKEQAPHIADSNLSPQVLA